MLTQKFQLKMLEVCSYTPCNGIKKAVGVSVERFSVISTNTGKTAKRFSYSNIQMQSE